MKKFLLSCAVLLSAVSFTVYAAQENSKDKKDKRDKIECCCKDCTCKDCTARRTARNVPDAVKTKNAASAGIAGTKDIAVTTTITARTEGITTAEEAVAEAGANPFPA